jgi:hypothetical protein
VKFVVAPVRKRRKAGGLAARCVLVDLLMAVMDSIAVWQSAAGDRRRGLGPRMES